MGNIKNALPCDQVRVHELSRELFSSQVQRLSVIANHCNIYNIVMIIIQLTALMVTAVACAAMLVPFLVFLNPSIPQERMSLGTPIFSKRFKLILYIYFTPLPL